MFHHVQIHSFIIQHLLIQGYPQSMRLQRRLYEICLVSFLVGFLVGENWLFSMLNHLANYQNTQLSSETKNQDSNCHIFRVLFFYSLILRGFRTNLLLNN